MNTSDLNWESILAEAKEESESQSEQPSAGLTLFEELSKSREIETPINSRRQYFIERLQKRSHEKDLEESVIQETATVDEAPSQLLKEETSSEQPQEKKQELSFLRLSKLNLRSKCRNPAKEL
jgi:RNase H-fold protein (predicted Holliday junction resolvase)